MKIDIGKTFEVADASSNKSLKCLIMQWIPPGEFLAGRVLPPGEYFIHERQFRARLSKGYWLGRYLVTQEHWWQVMKTNPSQFHARGLFGKQHSDLPVESVSWYAATEFCERLNQRYRSVVPQDYEFGLPTEVQWEYACRAGTSSNYSFGDDTSCLPEHAWLKENSGDRTHPVGEKKPNLWGFCDMNGNVDEWCFDAMGDNPEGEATDWISSEDHSARAARGGGYNTPLTSRLFHCWARDWINPQLTRPWVGFRLSLRPRIATKSSDL